MPNYYSICVCLFILAGLLPAQNTKKVSSDVNPINFHLINENGIGPISIGMTLSEVKKRYSELKMERTTDGDGAALITVSKGEEELMVLYAGEDDVDAPIDWSKKIESIETFDSLCLIDGKLHPGSFVNDVEKQYGKVKEIIESETESRQYATFQNQPQEFGFRINYCGEFNGELKVTNKFSKDCRLMSIVIYERK